MEYAEHTSSIHNRTRQHTPESNFRWNRPLAVNYGLATGVAMILFTTLIFLLDPAIAIFFRYANLFVMAGGAFLALGSFYSKHSRDKTSYLSGLSMGMAVSGIGALVLSAFSFLILTFGNADTAAVIMDSLPASGIGTGTISLIFLFETMLLGTVGSLIAMQFYKGNKDTND